MNVTEQEFEQCIERICQGDKSGLKDIYVAYLPYLYRIILGIVGNKENAEDITSDFFVKLWSLAPKYQPGNGHKGYLATIARNMAIDFLRKYKREIPVEDPQIHLYGASTQNADDGGATEQEHGGREERQDASQKAVKMQTPAATPEEQVVSEISLQEAMDRLRPEERRIIDMKVLGEMTFKEIAQILNIPMGTVTWRYQEGIKRLRRYGYE